MRGSYIDIPVRFVSDRVIILYRSQDEIFSITPVVTKETTTFDDDEEVEIEEEGHITLVPGGTRQNPRGTSGSNRRSRGRIL